MQYNKIMKTYYVYFITNHTNTVLYVGVTSNLARRLQEHRLGVAMGFSKRYRLTKLVYVEQTTDPSAAIAREKTIKGYSRARKDELVNAQNPEWKDISDQIPL